MNYIFPEHKKKIIRKSCKIVSTASCLPENIVSNDDIIFRNNLKVSSKVISKTLGTYKRRVASEHEVDSDYLAESARRCLEKPGVHPDELSRLIVTKFMGDNILPMTASQVQRKLGCSKTIHSYDIDGGISSFLYALDMATRYINSGDGYVLISSGGISNCIISKSNPRVAFLFGDGAASVLLSPTEEEHFMASYFYTNHQYYELAKSINYKDDMKLPEDYFEKGDFSLFYDLYHMDNWKIAEDFYKQASVVIKNNLLAESGLTMNDIDLVLVTENNSAIWKLTLDALEVPYNKSISLLAEYGNTMSAMLPLLLDNCYEKGILESGMTIMLISHGEGISGGGMIYKV